MFEGMDTSYGHGGAGFVATQDTVERKPAARGRGSPWIPVLTKDVLDILPGQDAIRRGAHESSEVTFVGIVRSVERKMNSASVDYFVDDNTGPPLMVNQLIEVEREGYRPVVENTYVRVIGKVRTWGNTRSVTAFSVTPLKNLNELTVHFLEATHCKLFYAKDMLHRHEQKSMHKSANGGAGTGYVGTTTTSSYSTVPKATSAPVAISSGLSGINGEIHKFLSTATNEAGYSLQEIVKRFPQLNINRIREQLELLSSEGHVYTTVDDEHYRTTDG